MKELKHNIKMIKETFCDAYIWCIYSVNVRIQSEIRELCTRNNSVFGHFPRSDMPKYSLKIIQ